MAAIYVSASSRQADDLARHGALPYGLLPVNAHPGSAVDYSGLKQLLHDPVTGRVALFLAML